VCADAVSGRNSASAATSHICLASFRMLETSSKIDTGRKYARMTVQYPCLPLQSLSSEKGQLCAIVAKCFKKPNGMIAERKQLTNAEIRHSCANARKLR